MIDDCRLMIEKQQKKINDQSPKAFS